MKDDHNLRWGQAMDGEQLERMAGGRVVAPTGIMRWIVLAVLGLFIAVVMIGMALLIIS